MRKKYTYICVYLFFNYHTLFVRSSGNGSRTGFFPEKRQTAQNFRCKRKIRSPSRLTRKSAHRNVASNNLRRLQRINRVSLRVEDDRTPERLQLAADEAARSGDLRTSIEYAGGATHAIQLWDELRTWDPGD